MLCIALPAGPSALVVVKNEYDNKTHSTTMMTMTGNICASLAPEEFLVESQDMGRILFLENIDNVNGGGGGAPGEPGQQIEGHATTDDTSWSKRQGWHIEAGETAHET